MSIRSLDIPPEQYKKDIQETGQESFPFLRLKLSLCQGWEFVRCETAPSEDKVLFLQRPTENWEQVTLPHTVRIEKEAVQFPFQGICWYRRKLRGEREWLGKRTVLEFGAGMQIADVWVSGTHRIRHFGGYLPFSIDLTEDLQKGEEVEILVRLDNRDTDLCPPGKPLGGLDFSYFGGLYREAWLHVTHGLHVSDPLRANLKAGGGIFVRTENASFELALLHVKTHVLNESGANLRKCRVVSEIISPEGILIHVEKSIPVLITSGGGHEFVQTLELASPSLWHPDHPHLHLLVTRIYVSEAQTDQVETRFGIRHLKVAKRFFLNGAEFRIMGTNRHQEYPFIGNAVPPNAQKRDARCIKEAGFNFVRLSHYPQDPSFLDACDELGILVQAAIPGWQQFWENPSFVNQSFQDIRDLVRRDRNHASIVFWEPNLNETGEGEAGEGHSDWCRAAHEITHEEYPGDQCLTFGDPYPPKADWDWDVLGLWREYGDFAFGGNESTSRHTRGEGEKAMLQQAWNYQWTYNHLNAKIADPESVYFGCATWVMFDYNRGYYHKPCQCGAMDIFRIPKYVYYFYQSQRDPRKEGPMLFIASDWARRQGRTKVVVFSNCDEIELMLNGDVLSKRKPDGGADSDYSKKEHSLATVGDNYDRSGGNPFDGGNVRHLQHPPFTFFDVPYAEGILEARGFIEGNAVLTEKIGTPGKPFQLRLFADMRGMPLASEGLDAIFVHVCIMDRNGFLVPNADQPVFFDLEGPGELLGINPVKPEAGIASLLLRTNGFSVALRARFADLKSECLNLFPGELPL